MKLFDATLTTLERALDVRLTRQNVLAGNLANSDTPGFAARDVDFAAAMSAAQDGPAGAQAPTAAATPRAGDLPLGLSGAAASAADPARFVSEVPGAAAGIDGNAVDVDRTLTAVAENAIQYGAAARAAQKKLAILRYVASDGAA